MTNLVYEVPPDLLVEMGLRSGQGLAILCDDPDAVMVPLAELRGPVIGPEGRGLDPGRLRAVLAAIAAGSALPALPVFREPGAPQTVILNGAHRYAAALTLGCSALPCRYVSCDEAECCYGYPDGQR